MPEHLSKSATMFHEACVVQYQAAPRRPPVRIAAGIPFTEWPTLLPFRCQVVQAIARHALASITLDAAESSTEAREEGMYP